jgi:hypothetical protein
MAMKREKGKRREERQRDGVENQQVVHQRSKEAEGNRVA